MHRYHNNACSSLAIKQRGSVLIVSMLILLVLTVIGAAALNDTVMEEKMASNFQQGHIAFQGAESSNNQTFIQVSQSRDLVAQADAAQAAVNDPEVQPDWPEVKGCILADGSACDPNNNSTHQATGQKVDLDAVIKHIDVVPQARTRAGSSFEIMDSNTPAGDIVEIVATGKIDGTNVTRSLTQGVSKLRPGSGQAK
ncbi:MAG: pilus assembly PilX N-terminal domain-containing protein [Gammaproteobacteria bacterium]